MRTLILRLSVVSISGTTAFLLGSRTAQGGLIACLVLAAIGFTVSAKGHNRSLHAQLLGIAGLTLPSAVALVAGGDRAMAAVQFWLIWTAGRIATTVSVRSTLLRNKSATPKQTLLLHDALLVIAIAVCGVGLWIEMLCWVATIPLLIGALTLRVLAPNPTHLKLIGWSMLLVNIVSGLLVIAFWTT